MDKRHYPSCFHPPPPSPLPLPSPPVISGRTTQERVTGNKSSGERTGDGYCRSWRHFCKPARSISGGQRHQRCMSEELSGPTLIQADGPRLQRGTRGGRTVAASISWISYLQPISGRGLLLSQLITFIAPPGPHHLVLSLPPSRLPWPRPVSIKLTEQPQH